MILTDFIVEVKARFSDPIGHLAVIVFRYTDNEHMYWFHISAEHDRSAIRCQPTGELLAGIDIAIDRYVNYILKVKVYGYTFTAFLTGQEIFSATDNAHTQPLGI